SVDRLLASPVPQAKAEIDKLGQSAARMLLRHQVSEQNRWYFENWELAQIVLGVVFILTLFFGTAGNRTIMLISLFMLAAVLVEHWYITPEMLGLGRAIDFVRAGEPSVERTRFLMFHEAYSGTEIAKMVLGAILTAKLLHRSHRSYVPFEETEAVG
ncbi:MAG: hypothetical protein M1541_11570, partial [Acidobacteria bacterium]|nr:hypothetical protein [Acidobacteriota bacterium]